MREARKKVTVRILDKDYSLQSAEDPQHLRAVAAYVDGKMRAIARAAAGMPAADIAVLTALNIADELHRTQRKHSGPAASRAAGEDPRWEQVQERVQSLLDRIPQ